MLEELNFKEYFLPLNREYSVFPSRILKHKG
jgi:hypothetical protein